MTDDPLIGRRLANFQVGQPVGRGGMAQVYYGQDIKLRRPVAIKVIDARYRDKPAYAERFVREAQAIATWRHENIIQIYYADDEDGFYYFVMEYIDGADLGKILDQYKNRGRLLPHDEVLRIGRAIANALDYAHRKGIIHRDVKPSNVMAAEDGRVVLTDFGLAMDAEMGSTGEVFGSAYYVAPEQARNSADAVPQSDLYSLGIILYEMLTGTVPFIDPSTTAVAVQHLTAPPPPPRQVNPQLSEETEAVLLKALSKSPQERYQTGRELLNALETALLNASTLMARPRGTFAAAPGPAPAAASNRSLLYMGLAAGLGLALILVLALVLGAIFFFNRNGQAGEVTGTGTSAVPEVAASSPTPAAGEGTAAAVLDLPTGEPSPAEPAATPTATPVLPPTETPTPIPVPQVLADTALDFAPTPDGKWRYIWARPDSDTWNALSYEERRYGTCWYAEDYIRICPDSVHPGNGANVAWYWTSLVSGPLEIQISARKIDQGGDGVTIAVFHNTLSTSAEPIFRKTLDGNDSQGFSERFQLSNFAPQDTLIFVVNRNSNANSDHTGFQAKICHYSCP